MDKTFSVCNHCVYVERTSDNWRAWECKARPEKNYVSGDEKYQNCVVRNHDGKCQMFLENLSWTRLPLA